MSGWPRRGGWREDAAAPAGRATDREVAVVAAVLVAGSEKAAAHRLGLSHSTVKHHLANARSKVGATTTAQLVWILAPRRRSGIDPRATAGAGSAASRNGRASRSGIHPGLGRVRLVEASVASAIGRLAIAGFPVRRRAGGAVGR